MYAVNVLLPPCVVGNMSMHLISPRFGHMLHRDILRGLAVLLLTAIVAMGTTAARAQADDEPPGRVGRIADAGGELYLAPQDAPDQWVPIGQNYPVTTGDNLWAGRDSRAEVDFGGGQFRLSGETSLHVSRLDERQLALFVAQGRVILRVRYLDTGDTARIDTPNAQIALTRPGLYRIDVTDDRLHTELVVREGAAEIDTGAAVQQVLPGQHATLDGSAPQFALVRNGMATDGFDTWSASRDRRYERGYANAPVSRQMVGQADLDEYGTWDSAPEYGAVWYPANVAPDWAPYRNGYWTEIGVWGPTWVDAAPWGYAPFHYGRWAHIHGRWGWCPGRYVARPVWAPALVGWVGGPGWSISVGQGGPIYGWVPLGWGEAYHPRWRSCSDGCWSRFNAPYAVNVTRRSDAPPPRWVNGQAPGAITAVSGSVFTGRKPVEGQRIAVPAGAVASAPVLAAPPVRPAPQSIVGVAPGSGMPRPASTTYLPTTRQQRVATPAEVLPGQSVALPAPRPAPGAAPSSSSRAVMPMIARPQPAGPVPTVSTNPQAVQRFSPAPANVPAPATVPAAPAPALAPAPAAAPAVPRGAVAPMPMPNVAHPSVATPAATQPSPLAVPQAARPAASTPALAPHVSAPAPAGAPAGRPQDAPKVEKAVAPVVKVPDTAVR